MRETDGQPSDLARYSAVTFVVCLLLIAGIIGMNVLLAWWTGR